MTDTENAGAPEIRQKVVDILKTVYDPEIPVNIYELGLVYRVEVSNDGKVEIDMTLTSPACPVAESLPIQVEEQVNQIEGVSSVRVDITWDPPWRPEMMSEAARLTLGM
jgi:FeS assembly SUF system protein